jgi:hypothetical protein
VTVTVKLMGLALARPPADTASQLETLARLPIVKGVPPVAAEVTATDCAAVTAPVVLLQLNASELGEGDSAEPPLVVIVIVTGMKRAAPVAGVNVSPVLGAVVTGSVPMQPGAIEKLNVDAAVATVEVTFRPTLMSVGVIATGPPEVGIPDVNTAARPAEALTLVRSATAPEYNAIGTFTTVAPVAVSQDSAIDAGPVSTAACIVPVQMTSARIARSTFRKRD